MLKIKDLYVNAQNDVEILRGFDLSIGPGEVHAIMGQNGSGKSTLANAIAGHYGYVVKKGSIVYKGEDIVDWEVEKRAQKGIFLGFQHPVEIPGVSLSMFLQASLNSLRSVQGVRPLDTLEFVSLAKEKMKALDIEPQMLKRPLNVGFSGGEKKRIEILHLSLLEPECVILDELDSGVDVDALKLLSKGVNALRSSKRSFVLITHYKRLLELIHPDYIHVLAQGKIIHSGGMEIVDVLEKEGYKVFVGS